MKKAPSFKKPSGPADKPQAPSSEKPISSTGSQKKSKGFSIRVSKFKHLKGDVMLKGKFENLKNLSKSVPAESNFFKANPERMAVPLQGK